MDKLSLSGGMASQQMAEQMVHCVHIDRLFYLCEPVTTLTNPFANSRAGGMGNLSFGTSLTE